MRRGFELFQSVDPQVVMQPLGLNSSDSRNRLEKQDGIDFAAQVLQHRQPAGFDQTTDGNRQTVADGRNPLQAFDAFARVQVGNGLRQTGDRHGSVPVRVHAERIRALSFQQVRQLVQPPRDLVYCVVTLSGLSLPIARIDESPTRLGRIGPQHLKLAAVRTGYFDLSLLGIW